ncbi:outer membrane protein [Ancylobacter pratisalsi]|uniref:Porin family protein n=1 Tax=Ancylobacter pratisalsi TaxID=1745854 RepID=A0A6P1YLW5_9HYPH|nr:outer membrane protein [Ancylobacter pratisalsi]QIB32754.1 porin family protein [Ancylobacter pratisalsi]
MNRSILAGLGLAALISAPAAAADLGYPAPEPVAYAAAMPFTWTGFYLGANAGYGWGTADWSPDTDGFVGGIQAGYNWQGSGPLVLGFEADLQYSNVESSVFTLDYFGTLRARAGFAVDQFLIYGTGGFAYGGGTYEVGGLSDDKTHTGWTLGFGGEYAVSNNVTLRAEYLYLDMGSETYNTISGPLDVGLTTNMLRAGVNYKF